MYYVLGVASIGNSLDRRALVGVVAGARDLEGLLDLTALGLLLGLLLEHQWAAVVIVGVVLVATATSGGFLPLANQPVEDGSEDERGTLLLFPTEEVFEALAQPITEEVLQALFQAEGGEERTFVSS